MSNEEPSQPEPLFCGVPQSQLERFLRLIRQGYPLADRASFFLEERAGISNVPNMANVRDTLSHLVTFLDPDLDPGIRAEQISYAEEHLRRAIIEHYQIAVQDLGERLAKLYGDYKRSLLPIRDRNSALSGAPNEVQVDAKLRHVRGLLSTAREAKSRNRWDNEWESGVVNYVLAFDELERLYAELESYWFRFEQINADAARARAEAEQGRALEQQARTATHHTRLHRWAIGIAIATFVLGFGVDFLAHYFGWW
jgi:hypothetical protein